MLTARWPSSSALTTDGAVSRHRDPGERHTVYAVQVGPMAAASGLRCEAGQAADLISAAAGLPPLLPRKAMVGKRHALAAIPLGLAACAAGIAILVRGCVSLHILGSGVTWVGLWVLVPALLAELDRCRRRRT